MTGFIEPCWTFNKKKMNKEKHAPIREGDSSRIRRIANENIRSKKLSAEDIEWLIKMTSDYIEVKNLIKYDHK